MKNKPILILFIVSGIWSIYAIVKAILLLNTIMLPFWLLCIVLIGLILTLVCLTITVIGLIFELFNRH